MAHSPFSTDFRITVTPLPACEPTDDEHRLAVRCLRIAAVLIFVAGFVAGYLAA
jgi:hypothetical protein